MRSTPSLFVLLATLVLPAEALAQKADKSSDASSKTDGAKTDDTKKNGETKDGETKDPNRGVEPPPETYDITNVEEVPGRSYFFIGARYRGNVIPAFMLDLFLDETQTVWTNQVGIEFEVRKDGFSLIPALVYHELGTDDILFKQKGKKDIPGNYGVVNSGMKIVYASVDVLWSAKLHKNVEFEYGAGFGIGAVFGDLENSWVQLDPNGPYKASNGLSYRRCDAVGPIGTGCNKADHQNSDVDKVGGYQEKSWFDGGSKPVVFPWIAFPQLGLRFKPVKNFVGRLGIGFALTGFWFGLSGQYGLEKKRD